MPIVENWKTFLFNSQSLFWHLYYTSEKLYVVMQSDRKSPYRSILNQIYWEQIYLDIYYKDFNF